MCKKSSYVAFFKYISMIVVLMIIGCHNDLISTFIKHVSLLCVKEEEPPLGGGWIVILLYAIISILILYMPYI